MNAPKNSSVEDDVLLDRAKRNVTAIDRLLDKPLSAGDLDDHTERVSRTLERAEEDIIRLLVFQVGDEWMALRAVDVHQVVKATTVHRIPHRSNTIIRGLCNLDGELMLCADLSRLLQLNDSTDSLHRTDGVEWMIVVGDEHDRWVTQVESVRGVLALAQHTFRRPPITVDAALGRYTTKLVPFEQETAALLDLQQVISGFQAALR